MYVCICMYVGSSSLVCLINIVSITTSFNHLSLYPSNLSIPLSNSLTHSLSEQQFEEMCRHRYRLYHPDEQVDGETARAKALEKIAYLQNARVEVARKKKEVLKELRTLRQSFKIIDRYHKRQSAFMLGGGGGVKISEWTTSMNRWMDR